MRAAQRIERHRLRSPHVGQQPQAKTRITGHLRRQALAEKRLVELQPPRPGIGGSRLKKPFGLDLRPDIVADVDVGAQNLSRPRIGPGVEPQIAGRRRNVAYGRIANVVHVGQPLRRDTPHLDGPRKTDPLESIVPKQYAPFDIGFPRRRKTLVEIEDDGTPGIHPPPGGVITDFGALPIGAVFDVTRRGGAHAQIRFTDRRHRFGQQQERCPHGRREELGIAPRNHAESVGRDFVGELAHHRDIVAKGRYIAYPGGFRTVFVTPQDESVAAAVTLRVLGRKVTLAVPEERCRTHHDAAAVGRNRLDGKRRDHGGLPARGQRPPDRRIIAARTAVECGNLQKRIGSLENDMARTRRLHSDRRLLAVADRQHRNPQQQVTSEHRIGHLEIDIPVEQMQGEQSLHRSGILTGEKPFVSRLTRFGSRRAPLAGRRGRRVAQHRQQHHQRHDPSHIVSFSHNRRHFR